MWLHSCPRCQGDLYSDSDLGGTFIVCAQCGHNLTPWEEAALRSCARVARRDAGLARRAAGPVRAA